MDWVAIPLSGDLPDPGLDPGLLHCRQILHSLSFQGSLTRLKQLTSHTIFAATVSDLQLRAVSWCLLTSLSPLAAAHLIHVLSQSHPQVSIPWALPPTQFFMPQNYETSSAHLSWTYYKESSTSFCLLCLQSAFRILLLWSLSIANIVVQAAIISLLSYCKELAFPHLYSSVYRIPQFFC